jgi:predicted DNA-binding helix-hairpin-helix protein
MEQVVSVARKLREQHHFRGYIHLKTIPEADDALITEAGKYADRLSINIEVPEEESLANSRRRKTSARSGAPWAGCGSSSTRQKKIQKA